MDIANQVSPIEQEIVNTVGELNSRVLNPKLTALRTQNPFVPIMPLPSTILSGQMNANTVVDINIPSGTKLVKFAFNGEMFVSRNGQAVVPSNTTELETSSFMPDPTAFYYVENVNHFSIISPNTCRFSVHCYSQL